MVSGWLITSIDYCELILPFLYAFFACIAMFVDIGYTVVAVVTPMDIIFIDSTLLTNTSLPQFGNEEVYYPLHESLSQYGITASQHLVESNLLDWSVYTKTHDETMANKAAVQVLEELRQKFKLSIY